MYVDDKQIFAYESLTVTNGAAVGFTAATRTPSTGASATEALLTLETAQIRWRADGTDPTTTEGHIMDAGQKLDLQGVQTINGFRAIATGGNATLKVSFQR